MHVTIPGWPISLALHLMMNLNFMYVLLSQASVVGFRWLMIGLCARLGMISTLWSIDSFTLK